MKKIIYNTTYFVYSFLNELHDGIKKINPFYSTVKQLIKKEKFNSHIENSGNFHKSYNLIHAQGIMFLFVSLFIFGVLLFINHFLHFNIEFKFLFLSSLLISYLSTYTIINFNNEYLENKKKIVWSEIDERKNYIKSICFIILLILPLILWLVFYFTVLK